LGLGLFGRFLAENARYRRRFDITALGRYPWGSLALVGPSREAKLPIHETIGCGSARVKTGDGRRDAKVDRFVILSYSWKVRL
jgi:hypothetical protein